MISFAFFASTLLAQEAISDSEEVAGNDQIDTTPDKDDASSDEMSLRDIAYILSPIVSFFGVALVIYYNQKTARADQWLKINEAEANYLQDKLDKFYGPFILESESNHLMAQDLRSRQDDPGSYRLLDKLFDSEWRNNLAPGDAALTEEICNTGERLGDVIKKNCGLVDPDILPYISRAITHFRILKLAYEKKLGESSAPYLRYVYPKTLDPVLRKELNRLQNRLAQLRQFPTKPHGQMPSLELGDYPLDDWPDPQRPSFDPATGKLVKSSGPGQSLLTSPSDTSS